VSRTKVVCRSAPASRSGSRVRGAREITREDRGKEKNDTVVQRGKEKHMIKRRGKAKVDVPVLAKTQAQNDGWSSLNDGGGEMCTSSSEDDDEGELDLARILVPPKRQNSIRSLRRHLHLQIPPSLVQVVTSSSASMESGPKRVARSVRGPEGYGKAQRQHERQAHDWDEDDGWRRGILGKERESLRTQHERRLKDGEEVFDQLFVGDERTGGGAAMKRRRGIPGAWATASGS
jgi:hypothetical protein